MELLLALWGKDELRYEDQKKPIMQLNRASFGYKASVGVPGGDLPALPPSCRVASPEPMS